MPINWNPGVSEELKVKTLRKRIGPKTLKRPVGRCIYMDSVALATDRYTPTGPIHLTLTSNGHQPKYLTPLDDGAKHMLRLLVSNEVSNGDHVYLWPCGCITLHRWEECRLTHGDGPQTHWNEYLGYSCSIVHSRAFDPTFEEVTQ